MDHVAARERRRLAHGRQRRARVAVDHALALEDVEQVLGVRRGEPVVHVGAPAQLDRGREARRRQAPGLLEPLAEPPPRSGVGLVEGAAARVRLQQDHRCTELGAELFRRVTKVSQRCRTPTLTIIHSKFVAAANC